MARRAIGEQLRQVGPHDVDHMPGRFGGHEQGNLGAIAHRDQAGQWLLTIGDDQHRWFQRDNARNPPLLCFVRHLAQVGDFPGADDLHPVGMDVIQVAHQICGRLRIAHRSFIKRTFGMGMPGDPFPAQHLAMLFKKPVGTDRGGFHGR